MTSAVAFPKSVQTATELELFWIYTGTALIFNLLAESARTTLTEVPEVAARARRLEARWQEQRVFDPAGAPATYEALATEVARVEPTLRERLDRLRRIAARLQEMLDE
jgi:hypothetical protein